MGKLFITESDFINIDININHDLSFIKSKKYNDLSNNFQPDLIKQICVHWSVTPNAKSMHSGLLSRGLSCNFMIDDDSHLGHATIFQNLPLSMAGWSQGGIFNSLARGIEIAYYPDAWQNPNRYSSRKDDMIHNVVSAPVHNTKLKVFTPTEAQYKSLEKLITILCTICEIPPNFPKDKDNNYIYTVDPNAKNHHGLTNHYNLTRGKVDTAGLDLDRIEKYLVWSLRKPQ